jgi:hypothetical protein
MSMLIAAFMFIALLAISVAHLIWSFGRTWPIREPRLLAQTVIGTANVERVPRLPAFVVGVFTLAAGVLALALADHTSGGLVLTLIGVPLAAIFLVRGVLGYTPWFAAQTPEPNFRLNDARVYSPLCLFLGAGFLALVIMRLI